MGDNEGFFNQLLVYKCNFLTQDLMGEFKPVVIEKKQFEYRDVSTRLAFAGTLDNLDCDAKHKTSRFSTKYSGIFTKFMNETYFKKMRFVVLEKEELQHKGNSILFAVFSISSIWKSRNDMFQEKSF